MGNRWETVKTVSDLIFEGSIVTADGYCSHEIKRPLLLGRKVVTNLDSILKSRDITLPTKFYLVKAMVFPVAVYGCGTWTVKKAEHQGIDAFQLWCWRRLLRVPWTAKKSNLSILKEISPVCSLEGLMLKLKLQYFGHLMWRVDSLEKTLMLGDMGAWGEGDNRGWDGWMVLPTRWTRVWVNSGSWWWTGGLACCNSWGHKVSDTTERLNWTEVNQQSYQFVCWSTSRLLPCPCYYKQCCDEHWGTHVSFNSGFLGLYAKQLDCSVILQLYLQFLFWFYFFSSLHTVLHSGCTSLHFHQHILSSIYCL